jgi:hypothetical protein
VFPRAGFTVTFVFAFSLAVAASSSSFHRFCARAARSKYRNESLRALEIDDRLH